MKRGYLFFSVLMAMVTLLTAVGAQAGPLRERLREQFAESRAGGAGDAADEADNLADLGGEAMSCAEWSRKVDRLQRRAAGRNAGPTPDLRDVAYGSSEREKLDLFLPKGAGRERPAPIIMMVHGGGWCVGDKGGASITENKVARWVPKGFIFVSVNYPMINDGSDALAQANHVARAAAFVQANAPRWGGDPARVILMGHSAGAHLVSLVNADEQIRQANGLLPVLGTVSIDAGAIDVVKQMPNVYPFLKTRYREAFGESEAQWVAASPYHRLGRTAAPWLGICSTTRKDDPCAQARAYAAKSDGLGIRAAVLPQRKSHGALNKELGLAGSYTSGVEAFMASLDPLVARLLRE